VQSDDYWSGTEFAPNPSNAWNFNTNDGNQNNDDKSNGLYAVAVRSGGWCPVRHEPQRTLFSLENLVRPYEACRRHKRNTANALRFEARQELNLLALRDELSERSYQPGRSVCFFVKRPKLREVFAADFRDRVVHHVLVSHLEEIWEPVFIHDSYACRRGKGVHAGVARLQRFMRQATANGTRETSSSSTSRPFVMCPNQDLI
jgi:hypothetical protein